MTKLYEAKNHILIHTGYSSPAEHRHMAAHIIIAPEGEMTVTAEGNTFLCRGIFIPSGVHHGVNTGGKPVLVFLYDSTTAVTAQIKNTQAIPDGICRQIADAYFDFEGSDTHSYRKFEDCFSNLLELPEPTCRITDERISFALAYIRSRFSENISLRDVAAAVFLSQGRFSHLFKQQIGMTFASYVIYQRIMQVYTDIFRGKSITEAALDAGFSGSAHFAETSRRIFGLSASSITQNLTFIKVE